MSKGAEIIAIRRVPVIFNCFVHYTKNEVFH